MSSRHLKFNLEMEESLSQKRPTSFPMSISDQKRLWLVMTERSWLILVEMCIFSFIHEEGRHSDHFGKLRMWDNSKIKVRWKSGFCDLFRGFFCVASFSMHPHIWTSANQQTDISRWCFTTQLIRNRQSSCLHWLLKQEIAIHPPTPLLSISVVTLLVKCE